MEVMTCFPSLVEATIVFGLIFCKSCVAVMIYFPSLVEEAMMFGLALIAIVLFPFLCKLDNRVCVLNSWQVWDA